MSAVAIVLELIDAASKLLHPLAEGNKSSEEARKELALIHEKCQAALAELSQVVLEADEKARKVGLLK